MRHAGTIAAVLALGFALSGCFFLVSDRHEHRLERKHPDPHVVILPYRPAPDRDCWRHDGHWHCRGDSD
jgi:hypothetical protein